MLRTGIETICLSPNFLYVYVYVYVLSGLERRKAKTPKSQIFLAQASLRNYGRTIT